MTLKLAALLTAVAIAILPLKSVTSASTAQTLLTPLATHFVPLTSQCDAPRPAVCQPEISLAHGGHAHLFAPASVWSQIADGARQRIGRLNDGSLQPVERLASGDRAPPDFPL